MSNTELLRTEIMKHMGVDILKLDHKLDLVEYLLPNGTLVKQTREEFFKTFMSFFCSMDINFRQKMDVLFE